MSESKSIPPIPQPRPVPRSYPRSLNLIFAADCFDPRFMTPDRRLTPLGALVNAWYWIETGCLAVGAVATMYRTFTEIMERDCPDTLEELREYLTRNQTEFT